MARAQFNLLPDIKSQYLKAAKTQKTIVGISVTVSIVMGTIFLLIFLTTNVLQKKQLSDSDAQIKELYGQLQEVENINKAVTVQNQLGSLVELHNNKHISSRLFGYLSNLTPINVSISSIGLDFKNNSMTVDGSADSQKTVNTLIDTLKFTTFSVGNKVTESRAFPSVVQSSFSVTSGSVNYNLELSFDPQLFANNILDEDGKHIAPVLKVPKLTTTRSVLADPANLLFNGQSSSGGQGAQ